MKEAKSDLVYAVPTWFFWSAWAALAVRPELAVFFDPDLQLASWLIGFLGGAYFLKRFFTREEFYPGETAGLIAFLNVTTFVLWLMQPLGLLFI